ncbi:DUF3054 domain-containing protein [Streptomonospora litoralis]|uniref:DUF3054 domain-containing protein n=1 Tax=Streptomonospora litoralis TaxID=2498135 RepID=A0A4P6Q1U1_9ACTN|nr:DUF3054 domain-containing protein [Streptomonospora litoralis]QBI52567.1 hypothetical protein EKD16_03785 [Streptomonospora litoralis]
MRFAVPIALLLDVLCVLAFAVIGRANHAEGLTPAGIGHTAWPFLVALAVGWVAVLPWRPWRNPRSVLSTGPLVWLVTVGGALQLRELSGDGAPLSFTLVTAAFLAATLLGWRGIARLLRRRTGQSTVPEAPPN